MAIQPTRPEAYDTGTLNQYAHIYDVQAEEKRARIAEETEEAARIAADDELKKSIASIDVIKPLHVVTAAESRHDASVAIGDGASVTGSYSVSIGAYTKAPHDASVALGQGSNTTRNNEVSVGGQSTRYIAGVRNPELQQDAATKNYVDTNLPTIATTDKPGLVKPSTSITVDADGTTKVNPSIFGDGLATADGKVSVDTGFVGEHLAGDALYYDTTNGLMVKTGTGLHIDNDTLSVDQDTLPLASADNRGTVKVGSGLAIAKDGTLSVDQNTLPLASTGNRGTVKVGSGLAIAKDGTLSANVTTMEYRKASNENITCDGMTLTDYVYLANTSYPKYDVTYYGQATKAFASGTKVTVDIATNTDTFNSYGCVEMSVNGLTLAIDSVSLDENGDRLKQAVFSVSKAIGIGDYVRFKLYF